MPIMYIYPPEVFEGGLPDEQGAAAAGSGPFELTLTSDAQPILVRISDNDGVFDEVDGDQVITHDISLGGTDYSAGTTIHSAYDLIDTGSGHQVTSLHMGGTGYEQGAVHGLVSTEPLEPGQTYVFNQERTSHQKDNQYDEFVACFVAGTAIATPQGDVAVETLQPGEQIRTGSGVAAPLQIRLSRTLSVADQLARPNLCPVRIRAGALGHGLPRRDLKVSPQHRMLVASPIVARMFGTPKALVAAKKLIPLPGVAICAAVAPVTYHHLVLESHQVIFAEGAPTESFYCGPMALRALPPLARFELRQLFPTLSARPTAAHLIPDGRDQKRLIARHHKNGHAVVCPDYGVV